MSGRQTGTAVIYDADDPPTPWFLITMQLATRRARRREATRPTYA